MSPTLPWPLVGATLETQVYLAILETIGTLPEIVILFTDILPVVMLPDKYAVTLALP